MVSRSNYRYIQSERPLTQNSYSQWQINYASLHIRCWSPQSFPVPNLTTTQRHNPEDRDSNLHRRENHKYGAYACSHVGNSDGLQRKEIQSEQEWLISWLLNDAVSANIGYTTYNVRVIMNEFGSGRHPFEVHSHHLPWDTKQNGAKPQSKQPRFETRTYHMWSRTAEHEKRHSERREGRYFERKGMTVKKRCTTDSGLRSAPYVFFIEFCSLLHIALEDIN